MNNGNQCSLGLRVGDIEIIAEGDEKFVKNSFWKLYKKTGLVKRKDVIKSRNTTEEENVIDDYKDMSLAEFARIKRPKGNPETCVAFGYYLQKIQKQDNFSSQDIRNYYKELGISKPANLAQDLKSSVIKAHLRSAGRGKWELTQTGERFVNELPKMKGK